MRGALFSIGKIHHFLRVPHSGQQTRTYAADQPLAHPEDPAIARLFKFFRMNINQRNIWLQQIRRAPFMTKIALFGDYNALYGVLGRRHGTHYILF